MNNNLSTALKYFKKYLKTCKHERKFVYQECDNVLLLQGFHVIEALALPLYPIFYPFIMALYSQGIFTEENSLWL